MHVDMTGQRTPWKFSRSHLFAVSTSSHIHTYIMKRTGCCYPCCWYGCEILFVALTEKHKLRALQNRASGEIGHTAEGMWGSKGIDKGKGHPRTGHEDPEEKRYGSTLSLTSALDGLGGQHHASAALPQGKTRYPLYRRLGGPQYLDGCGKSRPKSGLDPRTDQPGF
jgi:hypothetical protein